MKHYVGALQGIPRDAECFEDALDARPLFEAVARSVLTGARKELQCLKKSGELGRVREARAAV